MINFEKSPNVPPSLSIEKQKKSGTYLQPDVLEQLSKDFYDKCYLCEDKHLTSINVEHFVSHQGDVDKKFDWENLGWACGHCNNIKLDSYDDILRCTDFTTIITNEIQFDIKPMPKEKTVIKATSKNPSNAVTKTIELLCKIYNGHTPIKMMEANNLRKKLIKNIREFSNFLVEFYAESSEPVDKEEAKKAIHKELQLGSAFLAFKIWIIKSNEEYFGDFGHVLPSFSI